MKITIEEYVAPDKARKKDFYLPPIPWKWTLTNKDKILSFGYCHTEDQANQAANMALIVASSKQIWYD